MAEKITTENFDYELESCPTPVLVDFWADWCGPCKMLAPIIDELSRELDGKVRVFKANVDEEHELAEKYMVMSIPTLIIFNGKAEAERLVGVRPKEEILAYLRKYAEI